MNVLKITNHSNLLYESILIGNIEDCNTLSVKIITSNYLVLFDTVFELWLKHIKDIYVLEYLIKCYQITILDTSPSKCQKTRNILSQMISILAIVPKTIEIKYENIKFRVEQSKILKTLKNTIKQNKPFYPLFKILVETGNE